MRRLSLKEKLYRSLKAIVPADDIYAIYMGSKPEEQRKEVIELLKNYAKVDNNDLELRSKCLSFLGWYKFAGCGKDVSKIYEDLKIICGDTEIPKIIEENCVYLMAHLEKSKIDLLEEKEFKLQRLVVDVILVIGDCILKTAITRRYLKFIEDYLSLKEKFKKGTLNERETYIYDQIKRIRELWIRGVHKSLEELIQERYGMSLKAWMRHIGK